MSKPNNLDSKPPHNELAGKSASAKGKDRFKFNRLSGWDTPKKPRAARNKLAAKPTRSGLVNRSYADGVKLIERVAEQLKKG